jgi:hypothetical protein
MLTILVDIIFSMTAPDSYICVENTAFWADFSARAEPGASTSALNTARTKNIIVKLMLLDYQSRVSKSTKASR